MNCWKYEAHERHVAFDHIQDDTRQVLGDAIFEGRIPSDTATLFTAALDEAFVPNLRHRIASVPADRRGTNGTAIIPDFDIGAIDISNVCADIPNRQLQAASSFFDDRGKDLSASLPAKVRSISVPMELGMHNRGQTLFVSFPLSQTKSPHAVLSRTVIGLSRWKGSNPAVAGRMIGKAVDAEMFCNIPNLYLPDSNVLRRTTFQRREQALAYVFQLAMGKRVMGNYKELGESVKDKDPVKGAAAISNHIARWQRLHPRSPKQVPVGALALTHAYGPANLAELPTSEEIAAYTRFGLV